MAVTAYYFGVSHEVDAYNLSLAVPVFFASVIGGWLQVGFVGKYINANNKKKRIDASTLRLSTFLSVLSVGLCIFFATVALKGVMIDILVPDEQYETRAAMDRIFLIVTFTLIPTAIVEFLCLVLNCHGKFFSASFSHVVNATASTAILLLWNLSELSLAWSLLFGWFAQLLFIFFAYKKMRLKREIKIQDGIRHVTDILAVMPKILPAAIFINLSQVVLQAFCARLGVGAVSIIGYALKLHVALSQVLIIGVGTVLLPYAADLLSKSNNDKLLGVYRALFRSSLFLAVIILALIQLFGDEAIQLLFQRGQFSSEYTKSVQEQWFFLSLALFPFAISTFIAKIFQAKASAETIVFAAAISFFTTLSVSSFAVYQGSLTILVLSFFASQAAIFVFYLLKFNSIFGSIDGLSGVVKTATHAIFLAFIIYLVDLVIPNGILEVASLDFLFRAISASLLIAVYSFFLFRKFKFY